MLKMLLNGKGVTSDVADDGQIAVQTISRDLLKYDIIFMDNTMPVMNGVDATRLLRRLGFRNLIIGVTGNVLKDDIEAFYDAGADTVYRKPFKKEDLMSVLKYIQLHGFKSTDGERAKI